MVARALCLHKGVFFLPERQKTRNAEAKAEKGERATPLPSSLTLSFPSRLHPFRFSETRGVAHDAIIFPFRLPSDRGNENL